jgi:hypothetical protein
MAIVPISEGNDKPGVGDAFHPRENPRRSERSLEPLIFPA